MGFFLLLILLLLGREFLVAQNPELPTQPPAHFPSYVDTTVGSVQGATLGRMLFNDPLLSRHQQISCASCHQQSSSYADASKQFSEGDLHRKTLRNAPALINLRWKQYFFADGRANSLAATIHNAVLDTNELNSNWPLIVERMAAHPVYTTKFQRLYADGQINEERIVQVLTQYLQTLNSWRSTYDEVMLGRQQFNAAEKLGWNLFQQECQSCHVPPLFHGAAPITRVESADQSTPTPWRSVPTLRNIRYTAPYYYDGSVQTLEELLQTHVLKTGHGQGQQRSGQDVAALKAFLHSLSDAAFINSNSY